MNDIKLLKDAHDFFSYGEDYFPAKRIYGLTIPSNMLERLFLDFFKDENNDLFYMIMQNNYFFKEVLFFHYFQEELEAGRINLMQLKDMDDLIEEAVLEYLIRLINNHVHIFVKAYCHTKNINNKYALRRLFSKKIKQDHNDSFIFKSILKSSKATLEYLDKIHKPIIALNDEDLIELYIELRSSRKTNTDLLNSFDDMFSLEDGELIEEVS